MVHSGYFEYKNFSREFHRADIFTKTVTDSNKANHCDLSGFIFGKREIIQKSIVTTAVFILLFWDWYIKFNGVTVSEGMFINLSRKIIQNEVWFKDSFFGIL